MLIEIEEFNKALQPPNFPFRDILYDEEPVTRMSQDIRDGIAF